MFLKKGEKTSVYGGCYLICTDKQFTTNNVILKLKKLPGLKET